MAVTRRTFMRLGTAAGVAASALGRAGRFAAAAVVSSTTLPPLKFTKYYVGRPGRTIIDNPRFTKLLPTLLPNPQLSYWGNQNLYDSLPLFFSLAQPVVVDHLRWVSVQTAVAHDAMTRGLLWMDVGTAGELISVAPTIVWANLVTVADTTSLYLYSDKQMSSLSPLQITNNLKLHLGRWLSLSSHRYQPAISHFDCTALDGSIGTCSPEQLGVSNHFFNPA
jgi:hypothetical protein